MHTVPDPVPLVNARHMRKRPERSARLLDRLGLLVLRVDNVPTSYRIEILWADEGAGFRLTKLDQAGNEVGTPHDILLTPTRSSCECLGFLRWGHCKHCSALRRLIEAKRLPSTTSGV